VPEIILYVLRGHASFALGGIAVVKLLSAQSPQLSGQYEWTKPPQAVVT